MERVDPENLKYDMKVWVPLLTSGVARLEDTDLEAIVASRVT